MNRNQEHDHSYTIVFMDIQEKKMVEVAVSHCILCGEEKEE